MLLSACFPKMFKTRLWCSTCPGVLAVASWVTWFFSSWERKNWWPFSSLIFTQKASLRPFWVKIDVILWIFSALQAVLFFQLEKIPWLNSQQPKNQRTCRAPNRSFGRATCIVHSILPRQTRRNWMYQK